MKKLIDLLNASDLRFKRIERSEILANAFMISVAGFLFNTFPSGMFFQVLNGAFFIYSVRYWLLRFIRLRPLKIRVVYVLKMLGFFPQVIAILSSSYKELEKALKEHHEKSKPNDSEDAPKS